uniref:Uncharacterized protein n=1 Tax=Anguilla anguilla TaxID=7936 RepID=A0A0E9TS09_ANGAN
MSYLSFFIGYCFSEKQTTDCSVA